LARQINYEIHKNCGIDTYQLEEEECFCNWLREPGQEKEEDRKANRFL